MKRISFFVIISAILSTICNSACSSDNQKLELLSFSVLDKKDAQVNNLLKKEGSEENINYVKEKNQFALAVVKNEDRLSFVDSVIRFDTLDKTVVYNEGNGQYACSSTTVFENNLWVTKITFPFDLSFDENYISSVSIESLNFISLSSEKVEARIDTSKNRTLKFGWIGNGTYSSNGLIYNVVSDLAYISSYTDNIPKNLLIPEKVELLSAKTMTYFVAGIEQYAFKDCAALKEVVFERPSIINTIGEGAFYNCYNLESIQNYPNIENVAPYLFYNDSNLKCCINSINGSIGKYAFYNNRNFGSDLILNNVDSVDEYAFYGCDSLKNIDIDVKTITKKNSFSSSSLESLSTPACFFENESYANNDLIDVKIKLKSSLRSFGKYSNFITDLYITFDSNLDELPSSLETLEFENVELLNKFDIGQIDYVIINADFDIGLLSGKKFNNLYLKGNITFVSDSSINVTGTLKISGNTLNIPKYAFSSSDSIKFVVIEDGITSIGERAFYNCSSLKSITIPNSVTSIGDSAFLGCSSLTSITLPFIGETKETNTFLSYIFGGSDYSDNRDKVPNSLKEVIISDGCTSIQEYAFYNCSSLTSITIPNSVTSIGMDAFKGCYSLTIYCEVSEKPSGWNSYWNPDGRPVYWGVNEYYTYNNQFQYIVKNNKVVITGVLNSITDINIPSEIDGKTVTSIGERAFYNCESLTSITIPNSVTSIGDSAFSGCSSLTSINIPSSVTSIGKYAFGDCSSLTSINIPNSVTSIGNYAFYNCKSIKSTSIPNSVTSIGSGTFKGCSSLKSITIPNSVTSIGDSAFRGCSSLTSITIPNSVTSIGMCAFSDCSSLTSINVPSSVTSIGDSAFFDCSSLTSINIPSSVTSIGDYAFGDCSLLTIYCGAPSKPSGWNSYWNRDGRPVYWGVKEYYTYNNQFQYIVKNNKVVITGVLNSITDINIPSEIDGKTVTSIGERAFFDCSSLTSINIPSSVTSIGKYAFGDCSSLTSITIPNSLTSIGDSAFYYCSSLTSIAIPNSVTSIGDSAFYFCSSLKSITIPNSVTSIGDSAFRGCSSLTSITIPNSVTSIGMDAFKGCYSLTIYCEASSKPSGWNSYWNRDGRPVYWGWKITK